MEIEARPRSLILAIVGAVAALSACVSDFERDALGGRPCPCLAGWMCDESLGAAGVCVEKAQDVDSVGGAASHDGGAGAEGELHDDAGTAAGNGGASGSAGDDCAAAEPPEAADCPAPCEDCTGGTCRIRCEAGRACSDQAIQCPPGLHCEVTCSGRDSCKAAQILCSGAQACNVLCSGKKSCVEVSQQCADGPCEMACGRDPGACVGSVLTCGTGACRGSCLGPGAPMVVGCSNSCSAACGC